MWKCHKCGKPVYFAERKQSLGYDWHPECLRCEECGKRLNPGQHAEHKGVPYCHVPCYGALFGPQLFGHGTRVESHKSFGQQRTTPMHTKGPTLPFALLENKLKTYNQYFDGRSGEVRCREVNGRLVLEGSLRIHWGVHGVIHLKEDDDQRTVVTVRKRNSCRLPNSDPDSDEDSWSTADSPTSPLSTDTGVDMEIVDSDITRSSTLPPKLDSKHSDWDELDDLLQVERRVDESDKLYRTMPTQLPIHPPIITEQVNVWPEIGLNRSMSGPDCLERVRVDDEMTTSTCSMDLSTRSDEVVRRPPRTGANAIKRRPGRRLSRSKIKRRCSINGHFYNRETSFFTPPHGSQMSVWVTSLVNTHEVINLLLEKYKVESDACNFALFVVRDNGEQKRLKEDDYPLLERVLLGPHEDVVRLFLMDGQNTPEVSNEVAQFLNLSLAEMRAIIAQYCTQEEREVARVQDKFQETKRRIKQRMEELKVRL